MTTPVQSIPVRRATLSCLVAVLGVALLVYGALLDRKPFQQPGFLASGCYRLLQMTSGSRLRQSSAGQALISQLFRLGNWAQQRNLANAIHSGRVIVLRFPHSEAVDSIEFSKRVWAFGQSNALKLVTTRFTRRGGGENYEVLVEPDSKAAMEAFLSSGQLEKVGRPFE